jgi:hypothetical protein
LTFWACCPLLSAQTLRGKTRRSKWRSDPTVSSSAVAVAVEEPTDASASSGPWLTTTYCRRLDSPGRPRPPLHHFCSGPGGICRFPLHYSFRHTASKDSSYHGSSPTRTKNEHTSYRTNMPIALSLPLSPIWPCEHYKRTC